MSSPKILLPFQEPNSLLNDSPGAFNFSSHFPVPTSIASQLSPNFAHQLLFYSSKPSATSYETCSSCWYAQGTLGSQNFKTKRTPGIHLLNLLYTNEVRRPGVLCVSLLLAHYDLT